MTKKLTELNTKTIATEEEVEAWAEKHNIGDKMPPHIEAYARIQISERTAALRKLRNEIKSMLKK